MQFKTVVPGRVSGEIKTHKTLVGAKAAFRPSYLASTPSIIRKQAGPCASVEEHPIGQIFELINGQWVLLYDIPDPDSLNTTYRKRLVRTRYHEPYEVWSQDTRPWVTYEYIYAYVK